MKRVGLLLGLAGCLLAAPAAVANDYMVIARNFSFEPAEISILTGDSVGWRNIQGFHTTTSDDDFWDSSPPANSPWGFAYTFTSAGDYYYYCTVHGAPGGIGMSGIVHVFDAGDE
jgi:plastocyanin